MRRLLRLYPATWRSRYGDEMSALLDARAIDARLVVDVVMGALDAHRHPREVGLLPQGGIPMSSPQVGRVAILGGLLWSLAYLGAFLSAIVAQASLRGMSRAEGAAFLVPLALAAVAIAASQWRVALSGAQASPVVLAAAAVTGVGTVVMALALLLGLVLPGRPLVGEGGPLVEPWSAGTLLLLIGSALFAGGLLTRDSASRPIAVTLIVAALAGASLILLSPADLVTSMRYSLAVAACGSLFGVAWMLVGVRLLREGAEQAADGPSGDGAARAVPQ